MGCWHTEVTAGIGTAIHCQIETYFTWKRLVSGQKMTCMHEEVIFGVEIRCDSSTRIFELANYKSIFSYYDGE
jgi:hypothetical protein